MLQFTSDLAGASPTAMCIRDAIGTNLSGPLHPFAHAFRLRIVDGGWIDPRVFVNTNGQASMTWKSDRNTLKSNIATEICSLPLSADCLHLLGAQPGLATTGCLGAPRFARDGPYLVHPLEISSKSRAAATLTEG
jgi:hypothetical protein